MFYNQFKSTVESFEHFGGTRGQYPDLVATFENTNGLDHPRDLTLIGDGDEVRQWIMHNANYHKKLKAMAQERTVAMMYLQKVDRSRCGDLWVSLQNMYSQNTNQYPNMLSEAYDIVCQH